MYTQSVSVSCIVHSPPLPEPAVSNKTLVSQSPLPLISSRVCVTGHIIDPVPPIEKSRTSCPSGRFPPSFIHQVILITGLNKLYDCIVCSRRYICKATELQLLDLPSHIPHTREIFSQTFPSSGIWDMGLEFVCRPQRSQVSIRPRFAGQMVPP